MQTVTTIGLDIAKSVFQVHGVDAAGQVLFRRQLKRRALLAFFQKLPPCLVGIEACASSHHWSRELMALGHTVRLMPPAYVKPYVKRQKNDMTDAEAICEAVTRANMRFVPTKTPEQQSCLMLHRTRHLFIRQQTAVINAIRAHLAEFGIVAPVGRNGVEQLLDVVAKARIWIEDLIKGRAASFKEIAKREGKVERHIRFLAPLAFLSPKIITAIIDGSVPADLTITALTKALPYSWAKQQQRIGLTASCT